MTDPTTATDPAKTDPTTTTTDPTKTDPTTTTTTDPTKTDPTTTDPTATDPAALAVLAEAHWPEPGDDGPPNLPGFIISAFSPLVAAVADRCLTRRHGTRPAPPTVGESTAVVLISASGDQTSTGHVRQTVAAGGRPGPLLFYQSVPNSVVGHVAARWGLGGPVVCLCPVGDATALGRQEAAELLRGGEASEVLLVWVEEPASTTTALLLGPPGTG